MRRAGLSKKGYCCGFTILLLWLSSWSVGWSCFLQYLMRLSIYCVAVNVLDATRNVKTDSRSRIICWRTYSYNLLRQDMKTRFFRWHNYKLKHFSLEAIQLTTFEKYRKRKSVTDFCVLQRRGGRIAYFLSWLLDKKELTSADSPKRRLKYSFIFLGLTYILESSAKAVCLKSSPWCEMWKEDDLYCFQIDFTGFPANFSPITQTTQRTLSMQQ